MNHGFASADCVVYTAITRGYDRLSQIPPGWREEAQFIAMMEEPESVEGWTVVPLEREFSDPCRNAKKPKILPHRYFPSARYSLWVDGSIAIKSRRALHEVLTESLGGRDLGVFRHRCRSCTYEEAEACIAAGKDDPELIARQAQKYRSESYPDHAGLAECCVLFRRHTERTADFNEAWYAQILQHSRRDQLSFMYVANQLGFVPNWLTGTIARNEHFSRNRHLAPTPHPAGAGVSRSSA